MRMPRRGVWLFVVLAGVGWSLPGIAQQNQNEFPAIPGAEIGAAEQPADPPPIGWPDLFEPWAQLTQPPALTGLLVAFMLATVLSALIAYHPRNFGWVVGELVRRIDGRPIDQFVREEITGPLQIEEFHLGIDPSMEERVAKLHAMEDCDRTSQVTIYNRPEVHTAVLPAGGGIATARGLARFYAMMACSGSLEGVKTMKPETVVEVTKLQAEGLDHSLDRNVMRSLGLSLADPRSAAPGNENIRTFGHAGSGTSIGWANPDSGLAVAYITNGFRAESTNTPRLAEISQAVLDAAL